MKTISLLFFEIIHITAVCISTLIKEKPLDLCWQIITNWFFFGPLILGMAWKNLCCPPSPPPQSSTPSKSLLWFFSCIILKNYYNSELFRGTKPWGYIKELSSTKARTEIKRIMAKKAKEKKSAVATLRLNSEVSHICPLCSSNTKQYLREGVNNTWPLWGFFDQDPRELCIYFCELQRGVWLVYWTCFHKVESTIRVN